MENALAVAVVLVIAVIAIACAPFVFKDVLNMYRRSEKPIDPDSQRGLLKLQAEMDQQIAELEALMASECDDATLQRATEMLAEVREARERAEARLNEAR